MAAAPRDVPLLYSDREHCIAVSGNMMISLSLQPPNAGYLAAWTQVMEQLVSSQPGPICVIIVIDAGARPPDEASKAPSAIRLSATRRALAPWRMSSRAADSPQRRCAAPCRWSAWWGASPFR